MAFRAAQTEESRRITLLILDSGFVDKSQRPEITLYSKTAAMAGRERCLRDHDLVARQRETGQHPRVECVATSFAAAPASDTSRRSVGTEHDAGAVADVFRRTVRRSSPFCNKKSVVCCVVFHYTACIQRLIRTDVKYWRFLDIRWLQGECAVLGTSMAQKNRKKAASSGSKTHPSVLSPPLSGYRDAARTAREH
jgi:hypothetical protein